MKFKFQFESVLRHRKILEDLAQREFQEAQAAYFSEVARLEQLRQGVHAANEQAFQNQLQGGSQIPALSQTHEFLVLQDVRIERQQLKVQESEKRVEELREILQQKATDYKIIDKLKDRKKEEFKKEKSKSDQKKADDLSTIRFLQRMNVESE